MQNDSPVLKPKRKTPGTLLVEQEIERHGPMNFETFTSLALYHARYGYYNQSAPQRGKAGDYFTSLQVSDLFPSIFADAIVEMKKTLGTDQFSLVEWGSGDGEFLLGVIQALEEKKELKGMKIYAVEAGRPAREKLVRKLSRFPKCQVVSSLDDIEAPGGLEGCFFSNEFFDALPFRRLKLSAGVWQETFVTIADGELKEVQMELKDLESIASLNLDQLEFEDGQEIEIRPAASAWLQQWGPLIARGYVITVDYGASRPFLYSPKRMQGTWQGFSNHKANQLPYENIGKQDITAHVDFTALAVTGRLVGLEPVYFSSQGIFLSFMGQERIEKYIQTPDIVEQKKRISSLQQLTHPDAMGEAFWVMIQQKECALPEKLKAIPNRLKRLI